MNAGGKQFNAAAISMFVERLGLFMGELGHSASIIDSRTSAVRSFLATGGSDGFRQMDKFLRTTGIGEQWNRVLSVERAPFLAALVAPQIVGSALDLLC